MYYYEVRHHRCPYSKYPSNVKSWRQCTTWVFLEPAGMITTRVECGRTRDKHAILVCDDWLQLETFNNNSCKMRESCSLRRKPNLFCFVWKKNHGRHRREGSSPALTLALQAGGRYCSMYLRFLLVYRALLSAPLYICKTIFLKHVFVKSRIFVEAHPCKLCAIFWSRTIYIYTAAVRGA